jgi:hypothetical protein
MRHFVAAVLFLGVLGTAFGQGHPGPYWSVGGYGNVLYPGTGHAPGATPPGGNGFFGHPVLGSPSIAAHQQHRRSVIVPYPVYYGGFTGYDPSLGYGPSAGYGDQAQAGVTYAAPSVVINQSFVPQQSNPVVRDYGSGDGNPDPQQSGMKLYQSPTHPYADVQDSARAPRVSNGDEPTLYLIAFKDHTIVQALGFWMESSTLHYVSAEHTLNQASLDLIDRDLSQRLNDERGVEFKLPR